MELLKLEPKAELIWASPRELLNVFQAHAIGCHIIAMTDDILKKLSLYGKLLDDYSLETAKMFYDDARVRGLCRAPRAFAWWPLVWSPERAAPHRSRRRRLGLVRAQVSDFLQARDGTALH